MARVTIEDCLEKVPSRFALVHLASQRARQLLKGARPFVETDNKPVVNALREIAAGYVTIAEEEPGGAGEETAERAPEEGQEALP